MAGGGVCTIIFAFITPWIYTLMPFLICPCERLVFFDWAVHNTCEMPAAFAQSIEVPFGGTTYYMRPIQFHALLLGVFASAVAPFGGFFASGIKRAYKLDDFASIIPGHGGVFDRVDCQLIMGLATQTYYATFIGPSAILSASSILALAVALPLEDQQALYGDLGANLRANGIRVR